jgi:hypothetical protein
MPESEAAAALDQGLDRIWEGSQVAISGKATTSTTASTMMANIGMAARAMKGIW